MLDFFLEFPWWLAVMIAAAGVGVFWAGNNRMRGQLKQIGAGILALAVVLWAVGFLLDSPREKVQKRTRQFVASAEKQDWTAFSAMLSPHARIMAWEGRDTIVNGARTQIQRHGLKSATITALDVKPPDAEGTILSTLSVASEHTDGNLVTRWQLDWEKQADQWVIAEIRPLEVPIMPALTDALMKVFESAPAGTPPAPSPQRP